MFRTPKDPKHPRNINTQRAFVEHLVHMHTYTNTIRDFDAERPELKVYTVCKDMEVEATYEWCIAQGATHKTLEDCIAKAERVIAELGNSDPARRKALREEVIPMYQKYIEHRDKWNIERG
jgi:hypothetical protein